MNTVTDHRGNAHHAAGRPGAGKFAPKPTPAPNGVLSEFPADEIDEAEWADRMEAIIDAGEPTDTDPIGPAVDIFDRESWSTTPF